MSIEAGKELRVLFDVEPARIALDRFPYKFIARTYTRRPEMPVAQIDMPLRDGQAGLYPLFLMKSVHRIHPFIFLHGTGFSAGLVSRGNRGTLPKSGSFSLFWCAQLVPRPHFGVTRVPRSARTAG